jgi:peptide chain release factor 2
MRMYYKWAVSHNFQVRLVEESCGDEAGINSAILEITGRYAYGYLKSEQGSHTRIERISLPNGKARRYTCNACVEVSPILDDSIELEIPEKDLEITWPHYQGNVNRPGTTVQIVHLPTKMTVVFSQQRSPLDNKKKALALLKSKLWALMYTQDVKQISAIQPRQIKSLSDQPIREYILQPYTKVKDLRTQVETTAVAEVLDGKINFLIKAYLQLVQENLPNYS